MIVCVLGSSMVHPWMQVASEGYPIKMGISSIKSWNVGGNTMYQRKTKIDR